MLQVHFGVFLIHVKPFGPTDPPTRQPCLNKIWSTLERWGSSRAELSKPCLLVVEHILKEHLCKKPANVLDQLQCNETKKDWFDLWCWWLFCVQRLASLGSKFPASSAFPSAALTLLRKSLKTQHKHAENIMYYTSSYKMWIFCLRFIAIHKYIGRKSHWLCTHVPPVWFALSSPQS